MFNLIGWAIFGLIVGLLARLLVPGRQSMGLFATMALGVVGSLVGGSISFLLRGGPTDGFEPSGYILSIIGAIIVVVVVQRMQRTA